jgi:hypothetical protein
MPVIGVISSSSGLRSTVLRASVAFSGMRVPERYWMSISGQPSCSSLRPVAVGQERTA